MQNSPIFAKHESNLILFTSSKDPAASTLKVQLTELEHLTISMEPITGRFVFSPATPLIVRIEALLNSSSKDPATEAHTFIENLRALIIMEDFTSHGLSAGWMRDPGPKIAHDEMRSKLMKKPLQTAWFRRVSWFQNWWAVLQLGMDGERWFLVETYVLSALLRFETLIGPVSMNHLISRYPFHLR